MAANNHSESSSLRVLIILLVVGLVFVSGVVVGFLFSSNISGVFGDKTGEEKSIESLDVEQPEPTSFFENSDQVDFTIRNWGAAAVIPSDNDSQPDVAAVVYLGDSTYRMMYMDLDSEPVVRWLSAPLSDRAANPNNPLTFSSTAVIVSFEGQVLAIDRMTGMPTGEAHLTDEISFGCKDCLRVFDDMLVLLTADGYLHGLRLPTLATVWQVRMVRVPRQLFLVGGNPAVVDNLEDDSGGLLKVLDHETGDVVLEITPECPNQPFPERPELFGISNTVVIDGPGLLGYFFFGFFEPGCIQAWDLAAGEQLWGITLPVELVRNPNLGKMVLSPGAIYFSADDTLIGVSRNEGEILFQQAIVDYDFEPYFWADGILVGVAERTRGTSRFEAWGFDGQTGVNLWTEPMDAGRELYVNGSSISDEGDWQLGFDSDRMLLLRAYTDPNQITLEAYNPLDASLIEKYPVFWDGPGFHVRVLEIGRGRMWLVINDMLHLIDLEKDGISP